jgi:23S rRNA (uracil1939-C5)-methyltransferase
VPIALDGRRIRGNPRTTLEVGGITHELGPTTFYQVNLEVNAQLVADVQTEVLALEPERVLDFFAGAGNLSLPLAAAGIGTTLLEAHPAATKDAKATAERHGLDVDVRTGGAEQYKAGDAWFDVAIVDPPRAGAKALLDQLLITRPRAVVMVSCNPTTLAQDLRRARGHGYRCEGVSLYEMFPHTRHVEMMGVLRRD